MEDSWDKFRSDIKSCSDCSLSVTRRNAVIGRGSYDPIVLFIGEAPGEHEDKKGMPFVGRSGLVLDLEIKRIGLSYNEYYIANAVKCRPITLAMGNRKPTLYEIDKCSSFLVRQVMLTKPRIIVLLGQSAKDALYYSSVPANFSGTILSFIHPAFTLYKPKMYNVFKVQFDNLKKHLEEIISQYKLTRGTSPPEVAAEDDFFEMLLDNINPKKGARNIEKIVGNAVKTFWRKEILGMREPFLRKIAISPNYIINVS